MSLHPKAGQAHQCIFYVTTYVNGLRVLLNAEHTLHAVKSALCSAARKHDVSVLGYVLMPEHVHLLVALDCAGHLDGFVEDFVKPSNQQLVPTDPPLWRPNYEAVLITSEEDFFRHLQDMHAHPVRREITESATEFAHSSAAAWLCGAKDGITETQVSFGEGE
jgi:REP element-mobilizing transposase RayT